MDVPVRSTLGHRGRRLGVASLALAMALIAAPGMGADRSTNVVTDVAVKAAFLYNFAKFTEWPALPSGAPIVLCVVGDEGIAVALVETVRDQNINGHLLEVRRAQDSATWRNCHLLFIPDAEAQRSASGLGEIKTLPVLTVSDAKSFSQANGIIELYVDSGRMRFAINIEAAERSGLRLSSRLLGLARVTRNSHGP
jgi:hypothetical protein